MSASTCLVDIRNVRYGWADVTLGCDGEQISASVSYLTDGLAEFATAVEQVVLGRLTGAICFWDLEGIEWEVTVRSDTGPGLQLSVHDDDFMDPSDPPLHRLRLQCDVQPWDLAHSVVNTFKALRAELGDDGYLQAWSFPYPTRQIEALSEWLMHEGVRRQRQHEQEDHRKQQEPENPS